eukprot:TRINITY_DN3268_c0_g3_i1.p1 TRINITY_DN3268_c0_g3~~TRINITY_DN3268_c0_g3_i1.p1  ORF type:complete len:203 (-),score=37.78 TRINITY_DN3268_c0_g3_i1:444-1052(-)
MIGSTQVLRIRTIPKHKTGAHHTRFSFNQRICSNRPVRFTSEVAAQNPSVIPTTGEKNPTLSDDRLRVNSAMKVKTDQVQQNAENSTTNSEQIFGYSSVDFGNSYNLPHPIWSNEFQSNVQFTHRPPNNLVDRLANLTISTIRFNFDWMSGWSFGTKVIHNSSSLKTRLHQKPSIVPSFSSPSPEFLDLLEAFFAISIPFAD